MTNIFQHKRFRSWLHDTTLLNEDLCFCFHVAEGIDNIDNDACGRSKGPISVPSYNNRQWSIGSIEF